MRFLISQRWILGTEQSKCYQVCEILLALAIKRCSHGNRENLAYFGYSWARGKVMWPFSSDLNLKQSGTDVLENERIHSPTLSSSRPSPRPSSTQASWVWGFRLAVCKEFWGRNGLRRINAGLRGRWHRLCFNPAVSLLSPKFQTVLPYFMEQQQKRNWHIPCLGDPSLSSTTSQLC